MSAPCPGRPRPWRTAFPAAAAGDIFLLNDPYHGGSHLPDLTIIVPVFAEGGAALLVGGARAPERYRRRHPWRLQPRRHRDLAGGAAHPADPAGRGRRPARRPDPHAGDQYPHPARLQRRPDGDDRRRAAGRAAAGAAAGQIRRRPAWRRRWRPSSTSSEAHARRILADLAGRRLQGEAFLDDDGFDRTDIAIRASVTKRGESADGGPVAPATRRPPASSIPAIPTCAAPWRWPSPSCSTPRWRRTMAPSAPLEVIAREGTVVWAREGAPVTMCTSHCSNEIVEAIVRALAQCCPERAMGGWGRRFRVAITGPGRPPARPPLRLAHVPCAARRRRLSAAVTAGRPRRMAQRGRAEIRQRRDGGDALPAVVRRP